MRLELLDIPERRHSILPELMRFFKDSGGDAWRAQFEKFLRTFSGTEFKVPSPQALADISRDETIVRALENDSTVQARIDLLRKYRTQEKRASARAGAEERTPVTHAYLESIWRACHKRELEPPHTRGREDAVEQVCGWIDRYPSLSNDIIIMYALNARERARVMTRARRTKGSSSVAHASAKH